MSRHIHAARRESAQRSANASKIVFDGLRMGSFDGALAYTFYPGSRLIQQEAVLTTNDPDVAYYYDAGLDMARRRSHGRQQHASRRLRTTTPRAC